MKLKFRMHTPEDKPDLVKLWTDFAEWDQIDEKTWEHRFGNAEIALAVDADTDKLVGQAIFVPTPVCLDNRIIPAYRPFATFLVKEARVFKNLNPLNHPMFKMYQMATKHLKECGVGLIQMMPDPLWGRVLKLAPYFKIAKFPLWSIKLPLANQLQIPEGYNLIEIEANDKRLDNLWIKASELYQLSAIRDSSTLAWKTSHFQHLLKGIEFNGDLVGFVATRVKSRDRQFIICDIIASDLEALEVSVIAACLQSDGFKAGSNLQDIDKVSILVTDILKPIVEKLNFYKDNYNFIFVTQQLDQSLPQNLIEPHKWYVSAND